MSQTLVLNRIKLFLIILLIFISFSTLTHATAVNITGMSGILDDITLNNYDGGESGYNFGFLIKFNLTKIPVGTTILNSTFNGYISACDWTETCLEDNDVRISLTNQSWDENSSVATINALTYNNITLTSFSSNTIFTSTSINITNLIKDSIQKSFNNISIKFEDPDWLVDTVRLIYNNYSYLGIPIYVNTIGRNVGYSYIEDRENTNNTGNTPSLYVEYDSAYPQVYINTSLNLTFMNKINVNFNYTDDNSGANCYLYVDDILSNTTTNLANNTRLNISAYALEGNHTAYVNCTDRAGNINGSSHLLLQVDNTMPILNFHNASVNISNNQPSFAFNYSDTYSKNASCVLWINNKSVASVTALNWTETNVLFNANISYQRIPNATNTTISENFIDFTKMYDGNIGTFGYYDYAGGWGYAYINYTRPNNFTRPNWNVSYTKNTDDGIIYDSYVIPDACNNQILQIRMALYSPSSPAAPYNFSCYNGSNWINLYNDSTTYWTGGSIIISEISVNWRDLRDGLYSVNLSCNDLADNTAENYVTYQETANETYAPLALNFSDGDWDTFVSQSAFSTVGETFYKPANAIGARLFFKYSDGVDDHVYNGTFPDACWAWNDSKIEFMAYQIDNQLVCRSSPIANSEWEFLSITKVYEAAVNWTMADNMNLGIDTHSPIIAAEIPFTINPWMNNLTPLINITVSDETVFSTLNCSIDINGTSFGSNFSVVNGTTSRMSLNHSISEGLNYNLSVNCTDSVRNQGRIGRTVSFDVTSPIVNVHNVSFNSSNDVPRINFNISENFNDAITCNTYFDGVAYSANQQVTNWTETISNTTDALLDNRYNIIERCFDNALNIGSSTSIIGEIDTTPPQVNINSPSINNWTNDNTTDVKFTFIDSSSENASCLVDVDGNAYGRNQTVWNNTETTLTLNASLVSATNYHLAVNCTDNLGNNGSSIYTLQENYNATNCYGTINTTLDIGGSYDEYYFNYSWLVDANWSSKTIMYVESKDIWTGSCFENYTKPSDSYGALWKVRDDGTNVGGGYGHINYLDITQSCWDYNPVKLLLNPDEPGGVLYWKCYANNNSWSQLRPSDGQYMFEDAILWKSRYNITIDSQVPIATKGATLSTATAYYNTSLSCNFSFADTLSPYFNKINYSWFVDGVQIYNNNSFSALPLPSGIVFNVISNTDTVSGDTFQAMSEATPTTGLFGGAYNFDGQGDMLNISSNHSLIYNSSFAIELWFNARQLNHTGYLVSKVGQFLIDDYYNPFYYQNALRVAIYSPSPNHVTLMNLTILPEVWYHVVFTYDNIQGSVLYINGSFNQSDSNIYDINESTNPLTIGNRFDSATFGNRAFDGIIEGVKVFNRSLTASEVYAEYNNKYHNNTEFRSINFSGNFTRNKNVTCNISGYDKANNLVKTGTGITVSNTPPIISQVNISPSPASRLNNLNCIYTYTDYDGDAAVSSYYNWTIDGVETNVHAITLASGNLTSASTVSCSALASDGYDNSTEWGNSALVNLTDYFAPSVVELGLDKTNGLTNEIHYLYLNCSDADTGGSGLANSYPKVSFTDPDGIIQGNFSMSLYEGSTKYRYVYTFGNDGLYSNFIFYCRDAQANQVVNITSLSFLSTNSTSGAGNPGGGGGGGNGRETTVVIQNITLASFCGDKVCDADENPLRCNQDCQVNIETAVTCIWEDPKSCLYNGKWFVTFLIIVLSLSGVYILYKREKNKA
jgi:hypothetical protein